MAIAWIQKILLGHAADTVPYDDELHNLWEGQHVQYAPLLGAYYMTGLVLHYLKDDSVGKDAAEGKGKALV